MPKPDKPEPSVKRNMVTKSPEILAAETLIAVTTSETIQEAADKLGISRTQTHNRIKQYGLQEKILALKEDAITELTLGGTKAARNLISKIDSENESVSLNASNSVLDRVGLTKQDTGSVTTIQFNINKTARKFIDHE